MGIVTGQKLVEVKEYLEKHLWTWIISDIDHFISSGNKDINDLISDLMNKYSLKIKKTETDD